MKPGIFSKQRRMRKQQRGYWTNPKVKALAKYQYPANKSIEKLRTITNFRFQNDQGELVCIVPGRCSGDKVFLLGCVGSLNPEYECGLRLAAGCWIIDTVGVIEVTWMRIPVLEIGVGKIEWFAAER